MEATCEFGLQGIIYQSMRRDSRPARESFGLDLHKKVRFSLWRGACMPRVEMRFIHDNEPFWRKIFTKLRLYAFCSVCQFLPLGS